MSSKNSSMITTLFATATMAVLSGTSYARSDGDQLCALGSSAVGQPGTVICKNIMTGATTQSVAVGATVAAPGGIAGSLDRLG